MNSSRKPPSAAFWATVVVVVVLVAFPLSFGPACWLAATPTPRPGAPLTPHKAMMIYWPLGRATKWKAPIGTTLQWWIEFRKPADHIVLVPTDSSGTNTILFGLGPK